MLVSLMGGAQVQSKLAFMPVDYDPVPESVSLDGVSPRLRTSILRLAVR